MNITLSKIQEQLNSKEIKNDDKVDKLNEKYTDDINRIINHLITCTNKKVEKLIAKYKKIGIFIESYYIPVNIAGVDILVDPCRVLP